MFLKLSDRGRVSDRFRSEKWIPGKILLLFAPGHTPKLILTASEGPLEVGVAFSTAQGAGSVDRPSSLQGLHDIVSVWTMGFSALDSLRMLPQLLEDLLKPSR